MVALSLHGVSVSADFSIQSACQQDYKCRVREQAMTSKVFLTVDNDEQSLIIDTMQALGCELVGSVSSPVELPAALAASGADTLVVSLTELGHHELDVLLAIQHETAVTMVVHLHQADSQTSRRLAAAGIGVVVIGSLHPTRLPSLLDIAEARHDLIARMNQRIDRLQKSLEDRKLIDRAKGVIMGSGQYSEDQAYHALRKLAMNQNRTIAEVSAGVLSSAELFSEASN